MQQGQTQKRLTFIISSLLILSSCARSGFENWPDSGTEIQDKLDATQQNDGAEPGDANALDSRPNLDVQNQDQELQTDAALPSPVSVEILQPAAGSLINAASRSNFRISGLCDPQGSNLLIDASELNGQVSTTCLAQGTFSTVLEFIDSPGCVTTVFVSQSDVEMHLNNDQRDFMLDTQIAPANNLHWAEGSFASTTNMHATWQISTDPYLQSQRIELHTNSSQCLDANAQTIALSSISSNSYKFIGSNSQRYSFRIQSQDQAGNIAISACSEEIEVHPYSWRNIGPDYWPELQQRLQDAAAQGSNAEASVREISSTAFHVVNSEQYQGSVLAPNGRIYGIPRIARQLVELQSFDDTDPNINLVGPDIGGADKWYGAALSFNGQIYCSASDNNYALHVDPDSSDSSNELSSTDLSSVHNKWVGLTQAANGKLYACPRADHFVLEMDPSSLGASQPYLHRVGPDLESGEKWWGGRAGPRRHHLLYPL